MVASLTDLQVKYFSHFSVFFAFTAPSELFSDGLRIQMLSNSTASSLIPLTLQRPGGYCNRPMSLSYNHVLFCSVVKLEM